MPTQDEVASQLMGAPYATLDATAQKVARHVAHRKHIAHNTRVEVPGEATLGQRAADAVARFGGSWAFVGFFAAVMLL